MECMELNEMTQKDRTRQYAMNMRPVLNRAALFSDESANYRTPFEPEVGDRVTIKFRTWMDNVDYVFFICGSERKQMKKAYSKGVFDYYTYTTEPLAERIHYFLKSGRGIRSAFIINWEYQRIFRNTIPLRLRLDLRRRTGRKAPSCIRSIRTDSVTEIPPTTWRTGNISTLTKASAGYGTGTGFRSPWMSVILRRRS